MGTALTPPNTHLRKLGPARSSPIATGSLLCRGVGGWPRKGGGREVQRPLTTPKKVVFLLVGNCGGKGGKERLKRYTERLGAGYRFRYKLLNTQTYVGRP